MDGCIFCKVVAREIPAKVVYEDEHSLAFLDIHPSSPGHTMVIPKVHAESLLVLPDEEIGPLFEAVKKVGDLITKKLSPDGMTIGMNKGRASGQEVDHLHIHLIPRWNGDGGRSVQSVVNAPVYAGLNAQAIEEIYKSLTGL